MKSNGMILPAVPSYLLPELTQVEEMLTARVYISGGVTGHYSSEVIFLHFQAALVLKCNVVKNNHWT
ncbi:uncharacterized protein N7496_001669 [Penicillium cataractarum]|uniref:Uncharacterized protein n=1 Tax=Penicillium cataractarum TaxID=2100454 RepID=A0A9W9VWE0_9EURO|nr:uncharacterized protein N7496_001669 [Penicillium cataractarum]KAJ5390601.1 hypothetical protein N7496_001669 [Penicillium cataractarum]